MEMTVPTNVERVVVEGLVAGAMRTKAAPEAVVMEELGMKGMAVGAVLAVVVETAPHVIEVVVGAALRALWQPSGEGEQVRRRRRRHEPSTRVA